MAMLLVAVNSGCGLFGPDSSSAAGDYQFSSEFGFLETIVIRPNYEKTERFSVFGVVSILDKNGNLSGVGNCTRSSLETVQPGEVQTVTKVTSELVLSGRREGSSLRDVRISGCAFPRPMEGRVEGGRIVLMTGLDFPVSRGTTLISERIGDPTRLVLTSTPGA